MKKKNFRFMAAGAAVMALGLFAFALLRGPSGVESNLRAENVTIVTQAGREHAFSVEIAETPVEQQIGLMYRTDMPKDHGMIFLLGRPPRTTSFWMKNTLIPLDLLFVDDDGTIRHIHENAVPKSLSPLPSLFPVIAVIEINGGLAKKLGIAAGDKAIHPYFKG